MKCLLVSVNAKYIHSNPGILCLKKYYEEKVSQEEKVQEKAGYEQDGQEKNGQEKTRVNVEICEYTINQQIEEIVADIYRKKADIVCFSCYIWNVVELRQISKRLSQVQAGLKMFIGGPEVSYRSVEFLEENPWFSGIMCGEGERVFLHLMEALQGNEAWREVPGITFFEEDPCTQERKIFVNPPLEPMDMDEIPFIYDDLTDYEHRIIYYESSRGCPFSCSYCLSSIDKKLRFRSYGLVEKELQFFLDKKVPQVKFIDRTFNCKHDHAKKIWTYIYEHDNGVTNFHFEVAADLLDEEELGILAKMRPGLVQLEIGIQSTNPATIKEIDRSMNLEKLKRVVAEVKSHHNVHQHVDLIAGLPYEDLQSFRKSFEEVHEMYCEQLQLGFLKVLSGSKMQRKQEEYGLVCTETPPYEVLSTKWLSYEDVLELKGVEDMVEQYYNSGQFLRSLKYLLTFYEQAYEFYHELAEFYASRFHKGEKHSRVARYELLLEFAREKKIGEEQVLLEWLCYDLYGRENLKKRPEFLPVYEETRQALKEKYNEIKKQTPNVHLEIFKYLRDIPVIVKFDYERRDMFGEAIIQEDAYEK